jgi:uncharacterized protein YjbI with pentapeptide repeats
MERSGSDARRVAGSLERGVRPRRTWALLCASALALTGLVALDAPVAATSLAQAAGPATVVTDVNGLRAALEVGGEVIVQAGADYVLERSLDIDVPGTRLIASEAGAVVFRLQPDTRDRVIDVGATDVVIDGVTVAGGRASNSSGGGIRVARGAGLTLLRSTVTDNSAREGGGVDNAGTLTVEASTIDTNIADRKGGGMLNSGTATVTNSTFVGNIASQGGAISSPGSLEVTHSTIVRNVATSSSSAGVDRNGGTMRIRYSIIGANVRSNGSGASDCSGTPDLIGLNLVSNSSGCNPVGSVVVAAPGVGILTDNGGPTMTTALLEQSAAIDAVALAGGTCVSGVPVDQRGSARPYGGGCDLGAFELAPLDVGVELATDTSLYEARGLAPGTVEVGLTNVAVDDVLDELVSRSAASAGDDDPRASSLRSISLRSITLEDLSLRSIDPKAISLRSISLRSISLRSISLRSISLRSISLRSISLRSIPLHEIPLLTDGGWADVLAGTSFEGLPLQSITLEDLELADDPTLEAALEGLTLESIDLSNTSLRSISLRSIALAGVSLRSIAVDGYVPDADGTYQTAWCEILGDLCGDADDQLTAEEIGDSDLLTIQLAGGDVDAVPVFDIPLAGLAVADLEDSSLRSISLRSIFLENTSLRSISLRSISLRSIEALQSIVDCGRAPAYCVDDESNTFTLGDVATNDPDALLGTIGDLIDLGPEVLGDLSLGDLLLALVAPETAPWERIDLQDALLQNLGEPPQPTFDYVAAIDIDGTASHVAVTLQLPPGFALATRADDPSATFDGEPVMTSNDDLALAEFDLQAVGQGSHELRVPVRAGLVTGTDFPASVSVLADDSVSAGPAIASVDVVEANVGGGPNGVATLDFGDLRLAHVTSGDDADLYSFTAPEWADGATARVLLSNIPDDVDYDLSIYEPVTEPLRSGTPEQTLGSLADVRYDLDPGDDALPADLVDDVALDVTGEFGIDDYRARDISSRRSDDDEEVVLPSLEAGVTYYVAVTSYLDDASSFPYGLRLRVDETGALPACRVGDRVFPNALPAPAVQSPIPSDVDTLYLTNVQWLTGEVGATSAAAILDAALATGTVGDLVPAVIALDADPQVRGAYEAWATAEHRCSPDSRNDVVREIGRVLDDVIAANPGVENIVLVGGDGVVPMAAVRDRTAYSNEATFAREVLTDGAGNELSGALGAGYLLSDDPYATGAPIEIDNADGELYLPTRNIGRLVETGDQILQQLQNFVTYQGRLDPSTLPGWAPPDATVTGYDFLSDGADAVAAALAEVAAPVDARTDDAWDDEDYLDLFTDGGGDVISPNAHYDYESLLPAAADGTLFSDDDLVDTGDFVDSGSTRRPDRAVIFSVGCHAGLSVSDVQLGTPALDWSELYASGDNAWLAHSTFGYGDTEIVAYSERLSVLFADRLVDLMSGVDTAPTSLGAAIREAKHEYLGSTLVLTPYDEKILQSFTYYGLPMYTIGGAADGGAAAQDAALAEGAADSPVDFGSPRSEPRTGLDVTPVSIELTVDDTGSGASDPTKLNRVATDDGDYYEVDGDAVTAQYRPVQPLVDVAIPAGTAGAGFLITRLTSEERAPFTPRYVRPTIDLDANERRVEPLDGSFPATLQRVTTGADGAQRLLVAAGQYADDDVAGNGTQRLFTDVRGELYEPDSQSDGVGPRVSRVTGNVGTDDGVVFFEVETSSSSADDAARRVLVLYREGSSATWLPLDLFESSQDGGVWVGGFRPTTTEPVEFFVQAVDAHGDVGISSNKVENFFTSVPIEVGDLQINVVEADETNGYYVGPVTFEILNPGADLIEYSLDAQPFVEYTGPFTVSGDGGHAVFARDNTGSQQFQYIVIDASPPVVTIERFPDAGDGWSAGPVTVLFDATDVGQSGVDRIVYSASGATDTPETTVGGDSASYNVAVGGVTTVTVRAVDVAGNESAPVAVEVRIDTDLPTITATVAPSPNEIGWVNAAATVLLEGDDTTSGVVQLVYSATGATVIDETVVDASTHPITGLLDGVTTVTARSVDAAGNESAPVSVAVMVDTSPPTVDAADVRTVVGQPASIDFSCDDVASGVVSCDLLDATGAIVGVAAPPDTGSAWTGQATLDDTDATGAIELVVRAADAAGNVTTSAVTVTVGPTVCLLYDPTQEKNAGSNYTIKLELCDADGNNLSSREISLTALTVDGSIDPGPNDSGKANDGYQFRFVAKSRSYIYNLDTTGLGAGQHDLYFTTAPVPNRAELTIDELQALASNAAPFALR